MTLNFTMISWLWHQKAQATKERTGKLTIPKIKFVLCPRGHNQQSKGKENMEENISSTKWKKIFSNHICDKD